MGKVLESLEVEIVYKKRVYKCVKCGHILGPAADDYKNFALKKDEPFSKAQPIDLEVKGDMYVLREYFCPKCATMFEVDVVLKEEKQIHSIMLKS
jgi:acetone carboxylase gamma subunit